MTPNTDETQRDDDDRAAFRRTDDDYAEQILDAQIAAAELDDFRDEAAYTTTAGPTPRVPNHWRAR